MPTGGFIGYAAQHGAGPLGLGPNTLFMTPLVAPQNCTATAVLLHSGSAQSGFNLKALIYNSVPSTLLATGSTVTSMANGYNRLPLAANLSLTAGTTYYVGYICDGSFSVGAQNVDGPGSWYAPGSTSVASPPNPLASGSANAYAVFVGLELDGSTAAGFGWGLDQSPGITLSSSNTIATSSASANQGARSVVTHLSGTGKYYAETVVGGTINSSVAVGIASVNWGVAQGFPGFSPNPAFVDFYYPNGFLSSAVTGLPPYVSGDVVGIAYDSVNQWVWFNKNNAAWWGIAAAAGNPVTGTNPSPFNTLGWPVVLGAMTGSPGTAATFTLHDTAASLTYAPPSGYVAWSPYVPAAGASSQARAMVLA